MPDGPIDYSSDEWTDAATPFDGSTPFEVGATTGSYCVEPNGPLQAGWFTEKVGVSLLAGAGVTPAELVEFAQSLKRQASWSPCDQRNSSSWTSS